MDKIHHVGESRGSYAVVASGAYLPCHRLTLTPDFKSIPVTPAHNLFLLLLNTPKPSYHF